ncbi:MAG: thioredoxin family protein [Planctomycetaceae bacterium]
MKFDDRGDGFDADLRAVDAGFTAAPRSDLIPKQRMLYDTHGGSGPIRPFHGIAHATHAAQPPRVPSRCTTRDYGELKTIVPGGSARAFENGVIIPASATYPNTFEPRPSGLRKPNAVLKGNSTSTQSFAPANREVTARSARGTIPSAELPQEILDQRKTTASARPALHERVPALEVESREFSLLNPPAADCGAPTEIRWYADLHMARLAAVQSGRLLLISIVSEHCPHCARLEQGVLAEPKVVETVSAQFIPVRMTVERESDRRVVELLRIDRIPTTLVLSPEADLIGRIVGACQPAPFLDCLCEAIEESAKSGAVIPADGFEEPAKSR